MENFEELRKLVLKRDNIGEYIDRVKSIGLYSGNGNSLGIRNDYNQRYTINGIGGIIGEEKLNSIISQFEGLLSVELHNAKQKAEAELSSYSIVKKDF